VNSEGAAMEKIKEFSTREWAHDFSKEEQSQAVSSLEGGKILLFPHLPFQLQHQETKFLSPLYNDKKAKNISYLPNTQTLRCAPCSEQDRAQLKDMVARFSQYATQLIHHLFPAYVKALEVGRTSYRPVEVLGRQQSYRQDDTRLHVDAFPATPNQGRRLLRVFSNINPNGVDRVWRVGEPFENVAQRFLPQVPKQRCGSAALLKALKITKSYRTAYDHIMLQIHDRMKADMHYQQTVDQEVVRFNPGMTWIVQTDHVSHAAMSGQFLLEQTFYLPVEAMVVPERSPLKTLERMTGRALV
jgi:hypothetical protein